MTKPVILHQGDLEVEEIAFADLSEGERLFADEEGGVWRTIRGRRVFIREGEDVKDAYDRDVKEGGKDSKEADSKNKKALKAATKGLKLPGGAGAKIDENGYEWSKRGGHARNQLATIHETAKKAGWKLAGSGSPHSPDGSYMGNDSKYEKDGWTLNIDAMYGPTKDSNRFRVTVRRSVKENAATDNTTLADLDLVEYNDDIGDVLVYAENGNTIAGVEIFDIGKHNGDQYNEQDLDDLVSSFKDLDYRPAIKVGHTKDKPGSPSYGWVTNLRKQGTKLLADFTSMHDSVVEAIRKQAYDRVSSEIYFNLERGGKKFRRALKAVALLGTEVPAVANLVPLHKMEFAAESGFEACHAVEAGLEVPTEALVATLSQRVEGLVNLMKEFDMAKNAKQIAELKEKVAKLSSDMDAMVKKSGKKPEDLKDDEQYKQLSAQVSELSTQIASLEKDDGDDVEALKKQLAEANARAEKEASERKELSERVARIERSERNALIGDRVKQCKVPVFRAGLEAMYAYALEHDTTKVKVFSKDKDGKDVSEEKTLAEVVDGFVAEINGQSEKLFKALSTQSSAMPAGLEDESPAVEVDKRVKAYREKHPEVKQYDQALRAVLTADKELAEKYNAQLSHAQ